MRLQGERCVLRRWEGGDVDALVALANDPAVARYTINIPFPYTADEARWWVSTKSTLGGNLQFAITLDDAAVGGIGIMLGSGARHGTGMVGYWLGQPYWGRGLATDAARTLTEYAVAHLSLVRLWANVISPNVASARVLEKAGYALEATLRNAISDREGNLHDELIYVRLPR